MENMQYAEELVREFLVFRGFTSTLQAYESELSTDVGRSFQADKIIDLIFSLYIPKYQADKLLALLNFFKQCLTSPSETVLSSTLAKLELSILQYYIVHALRSGRKDKVMEFFGSNYDAMFQNRQNWMSWFALPYIKNPSLDPQFKVYFSKEWSDTLVLSLRNFLSEIFNGTRIPALLKISIKKSTVRCLKDDIKQLNNKLSELQALLEKKEAEICHLRRQDNFVNKSTLHEELSDKAHVSSNHESERDGSNSSDAGTSGRELESKSEVLESSSASKFPSQRSSELDKASQMHETGTRNDPMEEEEFPEVKVEFQETFLGHTSPVTRCRFSSHGSNVASASTDGTVRIWTYDASIPSSRNATIYCGSEVMSLDWERRSDRLLLIGTANSVIKAWNADAKRVVCDLSTSKEFPSILDLKCSPVEPIFVSAAASSRHRSRIFEKNCFASLTVWNMKTWKAMTKLPLGEDPPAITSMCFNHNGKILAASAIDGMIHIFDMSAGLQIMGWPAHESAISSVLFGSAETSIFSLATDGKIYEWSLHNQGQIVWSRDCSRFCSAASLEKCRHEIALDCDGRRMLVTSGSVRSPIYQVQGHMSGLRTLPHTAAVTSVDWHPTSPSMFITGSADNSIRITSIL